jgi:hypothetical protein
MKKAFLLLNIFLCLNIVLKSQTPRGTYYLTTNILSPFSGMNKSSATLNALLPLFSNLEYGFTLSGGYFKNFHFVESRITLGKSNDYNFIPQIQIVYNFLLIDYLKNNQNGFYVGVNIRYWDYINKYTKSQRHSISPSIDMGYLWKRKRFIVDVRLNQNFAIFTKTNIAHAKSAIEFSLSPMPELSTILPFISINLGYKIGEVNKKK